MLIRIPLYKKFFAINFRCYAKCDTNIIEGHYRCHPKIINFCNQKFYRGELIIMTRDNGEDNVLSVVKTVHGNHEQITTASVR